MGERFIKTENGLGDTYPIFPGKGEYQVLFSYTLPYDRKMMFSNQFSFDVDALVILVPQNSIEIKGNTLQESGLREVQGVSYQLYTGGNFKKGDQIELSITGKNLGPFTSQSMGSIQSQLVGLSALGFALFLIGFWVFKHSYTAQKPAEGILSHIEENDETEEMLLDAILALDDLYQAETLPEDTYIERRGELKARLQSLREKQVRPSGHD